MPIPNFAHHEPLTRELRVFSGVEAQHPNDDQVSTRLAMGLISRLTFEITVGAQSGVSFPPVALGHREFITRFSIVAC